METPLVLLESHREHKPFADPMKPSVKKLVSPQLTQRSLDRLMTKFPSPHHLVFCRIPANFSRKECSVGSIQAMLRTPGVLEGGSAPWPWCRRAFWVWEESIMEPDHLGLCRLKWVWHPGRLSFSLAPGKLEPGAPQESPCSDNRRPRYCGEAVPQNHSCMCSLSHRKPGHRTGSVRCCRAK